MHMAIHMPQFSNLSVFCQRLADLEDHENILFGYCLCRGFTVNFQGGPVMSVSLEINGQKFFNTQISMAPICIFSHWSDENISGYFKSSDPLHLLVTPS